MFPGPEDLVLRYRLSGGKQILILCKNETRGLIYTDGNKDTHVK